VTTALAQQFDRVITRSVQIISRAHDESVQTSCVFLEKLLGSC
jgi:hypothetical protein